MHIQCSKGSFVYNIDLEESESGDLDIGGKHFSFSIAGGGPGLDEISLLIRSSLSASTGDVADIKARTISAGFEVIDIRDRYPGSCVELIAKIEKTVHRTVDRMDYDGLKPYIKLIEQLDQGKSLTDIRLTCEDDERGTICTGMSLAILRNLYHEHHITGMFAGQKDLSHALVIVECKDGYVFIDNRSNKGNRLFFAPFNTTVTCSFSDAGKEGESIPRNFLLTAGPPGSSIPLTQTYGDGVPYEFCTNMPDAEDLIAKSYIQHSISEFIPIAVYREDGRAIKDIKVSPSWKKVILKDYLMGHKKEFAFEDVLKGKLSADELRVFMGPEVFHLEGRTIHEEIILVVSQIERIKKVFAAVLLKSE